MIPDHPVPHELDVETGLPVGQFVVRPDPARPVEATELGGRYCVLERLDIARHGDELWTASTAGDAAQRFLYLPVRAHTDRADFDAWMATSVASHDPLYFAVIDRASGLVCGRQSFLRIERRNQSIEIGDIHWGPTMSRTRIATEALFLFASHAFDELGYRRFEWKCNALNEPSRRAALRFGFTYEGHFRRNAIVKGRSRDTTWYSMIDEEWPNIRQGYETWLEGSNFDVDGRQRRSLTDCLHAAGHSAATK